MSLRLRDYNPTTGRFTAHDPVTPPRTQPYESPYTYVNNQPTALTDPSGACWWCVIGAVGGAIYGGIEYAVTHGGPWDWSDFGANIADRSFDGALLGLPVIAGRPVVSAGGSAIGRMIRNICPRVSRVAATRSPSSGAKVRPITEDPGYGGKIRPIGERQPDRRRRSSQPQPVPAS